MPSIFTLEGPNLGYAQVSPVAPRVGALRGVDTVGGYVKGVIGLLTVVLVSRWAYGRYKKHGPRLGLFGFGGDMLDTIKAESRSRAEYARRAEAWNAGNAHKLSDMELARRFGRGHHQATAQLIRQARREREQGRGVLWKKLAKGLKGAPTGARERKRQIKALQAQRDNLLRAADYAGNTREQVMRFHEQIDEIDRKLRELR